tara:strand:- start:659 stop:859 length:201 start_codon:yes stop_codon:yes gene_type:complete
MRYPASGNERSDAVKKLDDFPVGKHRLRACPKFFVLGQRLWFGAKAFGKFDGDALLVAIACIVTPV